MTRRRAVIAVLVVVGGWLIFRGGKHWRDERAAMAVVNHFLEAVRDGDRDAAFSYLTADRRKAIEQSKKSTLQAFEIRTTKFQWRINRIEIDGDQAAAQMWIEKDGFVIEPIVFLVRTTTHSWKIDRFENVVVDPVWLDVQKELRRREDMQTAKELRKAFAGQEGIRVERQAEPSKAD